MEDGRGSKEQMERAARLVAVRGRGYLTKRKNRLVPQVQVFSKDLIELDLLCLVFGGSHYHHLSGRVWVLQRKVDMIRLKEMVKPYLQDGHGLTAIYQPRSESRQPDEKGKDHEHQ